MKKVISLVMLLAITAAFLPRAGTAVLAYSTGYPNTHANTGNQIEDLIAVARTQTGYTQDSSGGTKYGAWYGKGMTNVSWCAMFVSWCADQADIPTDIIPRHADCDVGVRWFKSQGLWYNSAYYGGSYTPRPGDIVYYSNTHSQSDATHVGIVTGVSGNYLQTIEGNTWSDNNKICRVIERTKSANRTLNSGYILGYGTPLYDTGESADPPAPPSRVTSDKAQYTVGETPVITWTAVADADSYWAYLWRDGAQLWYADQGSRTTMTCKDLTAGNYRVQIRSSGIFGYSDATECTFTVSERTEACAITAQPVDFIGPSGATASFSVKASGTGLSYQWQLSDDQGANWRNSSIKTANYATTLSAKNDGRRVRCIVTDQSGHCVTSDAARMTISGPVITSQPTAVTALNGDTVRFTVKASGSGLAYQWQLSDDKGKTWRNSSVKTAEYATTLTEKNTSRYLRCIVTDKNGSSVTSDTTYMKLSSLAITAQPKSVTGAQGDTVTLTVGAKGPGITYQWQLSDDKGATWRSSSTKSAVYTTPLTEKNNGRWLRCIVTDKYGNSMKSNAASINAAGGASLAITAQPTDCTTNLGGTVTFTVKASGTGLSYQWQLSDDAGANWRSSSVKTANYVTTLTAVNNGRRVRCIVTDQSGHSVTSDAACMRSALTVSG